MNQMKTVVNATSPGNQHRRVSWETPAEYDKFLDDTSPVWKAAPPFENPM